MDPPPPLKEQKLLVYLAKSLSNQVRQQYLNLKIAHFPVKIGLIGGVRGVLEICFSLESSSFCYLGAHAKFHNPSWLLSGRKLRASEGEREKIMPSTTATSAHSARTKNAKRSIHQYTEIWITLSLTQRSIFATLDPKTRPWRHSDLRIEFSATTLVSIELHQL